MNPDTLIILISGSAGLIIGALMGIVVTAAISARAASRAEKDAWAAANLFYSRKEDQP